MSAELQRLAEHCEQQADRLKRTRPGVARAVEVGAYSNQHLERHDRDQQLWRQLADEINAHLTRPTTAPDHDLEEPLWETP